eukprot:2050986-Pyramimonas_sp.AAC.1
MGGRMVWARIPGVRNAPKPNAASLLRTINDVGAPARDVLLGVVYMYSMSSTVLKYYFVNQYTPQTCGGGRPGILSPTPCTQGCCRPPSGRQ